MIQHKAYRAVRTALAQGHLIKPKRCQKCGACESKGTDGRSLLHGHHHLGYEKPLAVMWLCTPCHRKEDVGAIGERNSHSKLISPNVTEIRKRYKRTGHNLSNASELADEFGVNKTTIQRVVRYKSWKFEEAALGEEEGK